MRYAIASPPTCSSAEPIFASSKRFSKQRQTARQHPIEVRITYPFHPRCGETVPVLRRFAYRGIDLVVIPQPDKSIACIPEWMTHERAAQIKLAAEPSLPLEILQSLRAEVDALLAFLPSESTRENEHETQSRESRTATGTVRSGRTERRAGASQDGATGIAGRD